MNICDDVQVHVLSEFMTDEEAFNYFTATQRPDLLAKYKRKDWLTTSQCRFGQIVNQKVRFGDEIAKTARKLLIDGTCAPFHNIPDTITEIETDQTFSKPLGKLPENLQRLTLGRYYTSSLSSLPSSLTHLTLGSNYYVRLPTLPSNLKFLRLSRFYNHPLGPLPPCLEHLITGFSYKHCLENPSSSLVVQKIKTFADLLNDCLTDEQRSIRDTRVRGLMQGLGFR